MDFEIIIMKRAFVFGLLLLGLRCFSQDVNTEIPQLIPQNINGKYGYVNQNGKIIIAPEYQIAMFFAEDCNLINSKNPKAKQWGSAKYATVDKNGVSYRINKLGKRLYVYQEKDSQPCNKTYVKPSYFAYRMDGNYGLVDRDSAELSQPNQFFITPEYQYLYVLKSKNDAEPMMIAIKNDKFGIVDIHNNTVIPFIYEDIKTNFSWEIANMFEVSKDGVNYFYVDRNNKSYFKSN